MSDDKANLVQMLIWFSALLVGYAIFLYQSHKADRKSEIVNLDFEAYKSRVDYELRGKNGQH